MLNMTLVVDKKDAVKYSIKIFIIIALIYWFSKLVNINGVQNENLNMRTYLNFFDNNKLIYFIDTNLHIAKQVNKKDENNNNEKIDPLKTIVNSQLSIIEGVKLKENKSNEDLVLTSSLENNDNEKTEVKHAEIGIETQVLDNNVPENFTNIFESVQIKNGTDYELTEEILNSDIDINNKNVIIFHTHTCESYTPSDKFDYEETGTFRTIDLNYSVARVGDELDEQLTSYGFNVIHDKTYHDYPAYNGSYGRSQETVENILAENTNFDIIIDLHRDAIGDYTYAPTVKIGEEYASQLMFVIGTDGGGLEHPNWDQNLKFAIKVQEKANEIYPGLFKPIILRNSRYNQQLGKAACIIEVGATGNTLEESICSMKYLAKVLDEVVK